MGGLFEGLCDWPHETPAEASKSAQSASSVSDWTDETSAVLQAVCAESLRGIVWIPSAKVTWCAVCVLRAVLRAAGQRSRSRSASLRPRIISVRFHSRTASWFFIVLWLEWIKTAPSKSCQSSVGYLSRTASKASSSPVSTWIRHRFSCSARVVLCANPIVARGVWRVRAVAPRRL